MSHCVLDGLLQRSPAEHVRRPRVPAESPTLGLGHLPFEAILTAARLSPNRNDFALVAMLGLLGLRTFEATNANIADLTEEHGHRVLRVHGKGDKTVLVPLPPAVGRALDHAIDHRVHGPILRNRRAARMDRHAATRRLRHLAATAGVRLPRMLRHTFVTTMLDAGVDLRDVQNRRPPRRPRTTMRYDRARQTPTATPTTSSPPTWPPPPDMPRSGRRSDLAVSFRTRLAVPERRVPAIFSLTSEFGPYRSED